nr:regulatory protein GemA [uncultured Rhodopila sp.]
MIEPKRRAMICKLHIARKELALAEESYRAILLRIAKRDSARDCTDEQLDAVLAEFRRLGWRPKSKRPSSGVPHVRKIHALWTAMQPHLADGSEAALRAFVRRQTKSKVNPEGIGSPEWLDATQANKVIEGLKAWGERLAREAADAQP